MIATNYDESPWKRTDSLQLSKTSTPFWRTWELWTEQENWDHSTRSTVSRLRFEHRNWMQGLICCRYRWRNRSHFLRLLILLEGSGALIVQCRFWACALASFQNDQCLSPSVSTWRETPELNFASWFGASRRPHQLSWEIVMRFIRPFCKRTRYGNDKNDSGCIDVSCQRIISAFCQSWAWAGHALKSRWDTQKVPCRRPRACLNEQIASIEVHSWIKRKEVSGQHSLVVIACGCQCMRFSDHLLSCKALSLSLLFTLLIWLIVRS